MKRERKKVVMTMSNWLKLALGSMLACAVLAPIQPAMGNGTLGSYAIVFDAAGEPLAGTYWIAPDVRVVMRGSVQPGPTSMTPILMDREFMPRRFSIFNLFDNARFEYSPSLDIAALKLGVPVTVTRQRFTPRFDGIDAMAAKPEPAAVPETRGDDLTMRVTLVGSQILTLSANSFKAYSIERRDQRAVNPGEDPVSRSIYIDELGMLISRDGAGPPVRLEQGQLISSADFIAYFQMLAFRTFSPTASACLEATRKTDAFKTAAKAYRDIVDAYTAKSFPVSSLSYEMAKGVKDIEPLIKDALHYQICQV
jgi:hypothetical protein